MISWFKKKPKTQEQILGKVYADKFIKIVSNPDNIGNDSFKIEYMRFYDEQSIHITTEDFVIRLGAYRDSASISVYGDDNITIRRWNLHKDDVQEVRDFIISFINDDKKWKNDKLTSSFLKFLDEYS